MKPPQQPDPVVAALRTRRLDADMSLRTAGRHAGYSDQSVWRWETGRADPPIDGVIGYAKAFGLRMVAVDDAAGLQLPAADLTALVRLLRGRRVVAGITPERAGRRMGWSAAMVRRWDSGDATPRVDAARAYADVVGLRLALVDDAGREVAA